MIDGDRELSPVESFPRTSLAFELELQLEKPNSVSPHS